MKSPNDYPQVKFRPGKMIDSIVARSSEQSNGAYSQTVKDDLADYYALLALSLPEFTRAEREILCIALNGWLATIENAHALWVEVDAYLDTLPMAMIEQESFVARLRALSRFECWSLVDAWKRGALCPVR